jgi:flavodoxin
VLVVYYSRTGNTRRVASEIARAVPCAIEEIQDGRDRSGLVGYLRSGFEAWRRRRVVLRESRFDPRHFDLVIIGTPTWNASVSSPVRAYLDRHRDGLPEVAFFVTCGGTGGARVAWQLEQLAGRTPRGVLVLRERDLDEAPARAAAFVAELERGLVRRSVA